MSTEGAGKPEAKKEAKGSSERGMEAKGFRQEWLDSQERHEHILRIIWAMAMLPVFLLPGGWIGYILAADHKSPALSILTGAGVSGGIWFYSMYTIVLFWWLKARRAVQDRIDLEIAQKKVREADEEISAATDLGLLWSATQKRLDFYHGLATGQSRKSFVYVQLASAVGFVILILCVVLASIAKQAVVSVAATLIGVGGGALSAYLGRTFMRSQENATAQLREYFNQPLEFSRVLTAERLIKTLTDTTDRGAAVRFVVEAIASDLSGPASSNQENPPKPQVFRRRRRTRR